MTLIRDFILILLFLSIGHIFYQNYKIPSGSMEDTLLVGDHVIVDKKYYGITIPRLPLLGIEILPDINKNGHLTFLEDFLSSTFSYKKNRVVQGDIVAFEYPLSPNIAYVKRAVVTEGNSFFITKEGIWIEKQTHNINQYKEQKIDNKIFILNPNIIDFNIQNKNNIFLNQITLLEDKGLTKKDIDNKIIYTVNKNHTFFMGDNRNNSKDSRWFGAVSDDNLLGKVIYRFFEWNEKGFGFNRNQSF